MRLRGTRILPLALGLAVGAGCGGSAAVSVPGGDPDAGVALIEEYGCGSCHTIGGVDNADADVGPDLRGLAERDQIAGRLPNRVPDLVHWIADPQEVAPGSLMPDTGVSDDEAADIAAYLLSEENQ